ncbi:acyl carrier protein [Acidiferrobacter thiooxydans]|uniref:acyl carrier protein n=1 Tax=Acidiferrobacter thiooxydans TaxID=163359 RepID=UPI00082699DD|nr:phosphopantetheine-binding protein [Acidiferrobacter thiooxydans]UEN98517.1 acyl carrier protein [Acidiferrobacter thiooxydans]
MLDELIFLDMVNEHMGTDLSTADLDRPLVNIDDWDSLNAVRMMTQLERSFGIRVPIARFIEATSLRQIYALIGSIVPA